jgi:hypothetical protein
MTIWSTRFKNSVTTFQAAIRKISYEKSDQLSNTTTDRDFINDYPIIRIYDDKIRLLFIKPYSTSTETLAQSDHRGKPVGQIRAHAPELVCVE